MYNIMVYTVNNKGLSYTTFVLLIISVYTTKHINRDNRRIICFTHTYVLIAYYIT